MFFKGYPAARQALGGMHSLFQLKVGRDPESPFSGITGNTTLIHMPMLFGN